LMRSTSLSAATTSRSILSERSSMSERFASASACSLLPGRATVSRISEKLELDDAALAYVAHASLVPGSPVSVVGRDGDVVVLESDAGEQRVPREFADLLFVARADR